MPMLPGGWRQYAAVFIVMGTVSVVYGAVVALGREGTRRDARRPRRPRRATCPARARRFELRNIRRKFC